MLTLALLSSGVNGDSLGLAHPVRGRVDGGTALQPP